MYGRLIGKYAEAVSPVGVILSLVSLVLFKSLFFHDT